MKTMITGGTGTLGSQFKIIIDKNDDFLFPTRQEVDVTDYEQVSRYITDNKIQSVIHCAAFTDVKESEQNIEKCIDVNIHGTCNILKSCIKNDIRMVYISTDHVFDGKKGDYIEEDLINPIGVYAKSKAAAEVACRMYKKCLIIRTSFYGHNFPYDKAFIDQWSTKDYVDIMAPKILDLCLSERIGIHHCFSKKRTTYEIAKERSDKIQKIRRKDFNFHILRDISLTKGDKK